MCRFCRHHDFLPPFNVYRPSIATAVAVVVNAGALRCNLTQGTFINVLDSFWSVIFIFITRTLQGDLRASALPWLLHTAILFSWPRKDEKSLWKALDTFGKKINVPWKKNDGLDMTTYTSLYQKQLPRFALGWERRTGWVACWFLQILCQSSLLLASWTQPTDFRNPTDIGSSTNQCFQQMNPSRIQSMSTNYNLFPPQYLTNISHAEAAE